MGAYLASLQDMETFVSHPFLLFSTTATFPGVAGGVGVVMLSFSSIAPQCGNRVHGELENLYNNGCDLYPGGIVEAGSCHPFQARQAGEGRGEDCLLRVLGCENIYRNSSSEIYMQWDTWNRLFPFRPEEQPLPGAAWT